MPAHEGAQAGICGQKAWRFGRGDDPGRPPCVRLGTVRSDVSLSATRGLRRPSHRLSPPSVWLLLILLGALAAACDPWAVNIRIPANLRTPSIAGIVEDEAQLPNGHWQYRLADGQTLEIDYDQTTSLLGGPHLGYLLLAGTDSDGGRWVAGVEGDWPGRPPGCLLLPDQGRADDGWIETVDGFRLPKAADFHDFRGNPDDTFTSPTGVFCLNERGEVTSYDIG